MGDLQLQGSVCRLLKSPFNMKQPFLSLGLIICTLLALAPTIYAASNMTIPTQNNSSIYGKLPIADSQQMQATRMMINQVRNGA